MRLTTTLPATLALLSLATTPAAAQKVAANAFNDQLGRLPPIQQRSVLRRAVLDGGGYCRRIGDVRFQQSFKNLKMWAVRCDTRADYGVFIGPDASVQVRLCTDLVKLPLPKCRLDGLKPGPTPPPRTKP